MCGNFVTMRISLRISAFSMTTMFVTICNYLCLHQNAISVSISTRWIIVLFCFWFCYIFRTNLVTLRHLRTSFFLNFSNSMTSERPYFNRYFCRSCFPETRIILSYRSVSKMSSNSISKAMLLCVRILLYVHPLFGIIIVLLGCITGLARPSVRPSHTVVSWHGWWYVC